MASDVGPSTFDTSTWRARIAAAKEFVAGRLEPGKPVEGAGLILEIAEALAGIKDVDRGRVAAHPRFNELAEVEHLAVEALEELHSEGLIRIDLENGSKTWLTRELWKTMGWPPATEPYVVEFRVPRFVMAKQKLLDQRSERTGLANLDEIQWEQVRSLYFQAREARWAGLNVAAAVVLRAAVEQAVRAALAMGDDDADSNLARLIQKLFETVRPKHWKVEPLSHAATRDCFSAVRDDGNFAVHRGFVRDELSLEFTLHRLPAALVSLSNNTDGIDKGA
ncbi:MAG: DUF4145 domain-containing protein [Acidimicrobiales bacterium]